MKSLTEYIEESLNEDLLQHIEYEYRWYNNIIHESYGVFNGAKEIADLIYTSLKANKSSIIIDCSNICDFFKKIKLTIKTGKFVYAEFDEQKDDVIYLNLYLPNNFSYGDYLDEINRLVIHELLHAYENYNRIKHKAGSIQDLMNKQYLSAIRNLRSADENISNISKCIYFFNDAEINAYFSSLKSTIEKIIKDNKINRNNINFKFIVNEITKTEIWKQYFELSIFIENLKNNDWKNLIQKIYDKNKSIDQIYNELMKKWKRFKNKFDNFVPKIICEFICN